MLSRLRGLAAPIAAALLLAGCGGGHHAPYKTLPRPPLGGTHLVAPPDCSKLPAKQHVAGACLPHPAGDPGPQKPSADLGAVRVASGSGIYGPDLSNNDPASCAGVGRIATQNRFLYVKSTEGTGYYDSTAAGMAACAKANHLPVGGYDFQHVCGNSATAEADHFVDALNAQGLLGAGTMPPAADAEYGSGSCGGRSWEDAWINRVHSRTGRWPIVYTGAWWWQPNMGSYWPGNLQSWISGYGVSYPYMPSGLSHLDFWQYTDHGWDGDANVDMSVYRNGEAAFRALANQKPPPPPDPRHFNHFATADKHAPGLHGGPFETRHGRQDERQVILHYVGARKHARQYAGYIRLLRSECDDLQGRLWSLYVHHKLDNWHPYYSGERHYRLSLCAQGKGV